MDRKRSTIISEDQDERKSKLNKKLKKIEKKALAQIDLSNIPETIKTQLDILTGQKNFLELNSNITEIELTRILKSAKIMMGGIHKSIGMICSSDCLLIERCPLAIINKAPYQIDIDNKTECPIEDSMGDALLNKYLTSYADRQTLDINDVKADVFVMNLLEELASNHLLINRVNAKMATDGIFREEAVAINNSGDVASNTEESPLLRLLTKTLRRNDQIFKQLLLTPEMELKKKFVKGIIRENRKDKLAEKVKAYYEMDDIEDKGFFELKNKDFKGSP